MLAIYVDYFLPWWHHYAANFKITGATVSSRLTHCKVVNENEHVRLGDLHS